MSMSWCIPISVMFKKNVCLKQMQYGESLCHSTAGIPVYHQASLKSVLHAMDHFLFYVINSSLIPLKSGPCHHS